MSVQLATFGAGCFWGIEYKLSKIPGVLETVVGYMGGRTQQPTYKEVCTDETGHAEVVQLKYDDSKLKYEDLLHSFWNMHDPTAMNRQGPDEGSQYRTAIFYHSEEQKNIAEKSKDELNASGLYSKPIATEIVPAAEFWRAEDYHQKYVMLGRHRWTMKGLTH